MAVNPYDLSETPIVAQLGIQQTQPLQGLEGVGALGELPAGSSPAYDQSGNISQRFYYDASGNAIDMSTGRPWMGVSEGPGGPNANVPYEVKNAPISATNPVKNYTGQQTIPLYQLQSFTPEETINLQDVYGTSAMPIFEWVRKIQVGEKLYDPSSPSDQSLLEQYEALVDEYGVPAGMPSPAKISAGDIALATIGASAGPIASTLVAGATDPFLVGSDKITGTAKQFLPFTDDLPSVAVNKASSIALDYAKIGELGANEAIIPQLATKKTATLSAQYGDFKRLANAPGSRFIEAANGEKMLVVDVNQAAKMGYVDIPSGPTLEIGGYPQATTGTPAVKEGMLKSTGSNAIITANTKVPTYWEGVTDRFTGSQAGTTWGQAGTMAAIDFGVRVLSGQKPVEAAKSAGAAGVVYATAFALSMGNPWIASIAATTLGPSVQKAGSKVVKETKGALDSVGDVLGDVGGGVKKVGEAVASGAEKIVSAPIKIAEKIVGGRVICNELRRQGLLETKDVLLDYKFTKEHLTPQHVAGYHFWAVKVVKRLRKGKGVKLWKHIAGHRANEIAYIYGERDKPDYLGKLYRKIFEPVCWGIGLFCKETDWSVLYEDKEIC